MFFPHVSLWGVNGSVKQFKIKYGLRLNDLASEMAISVHLVTVDVAVNMFSFHHYV